MKIALFIDMIKKWVYDGDMIAKSVIEDDHLVLLKNIIDWLRKYDLKFNPNKCVFGATFENY